jgi:O-antigen ligase
MMKRLITNIHASKYLLILAIFILLVSFGVLAAKGLWVILVGFNVGLGIFFLVVFLPQGPQLGLCLVVASLLLDSKGIPGPITVSPSNIFLLLTLISIGLRFLRHKNKDIGMARAGWLGVVLGFGLLVGAFLSLTRAEYPAFALRGSVTVVGDILIFTLALALTRTRADIATLVRIYLWSAVVCALFGIAQILLYMFMGITIGRVDNLVGESLLLVPRVSSTWIDPNIYGLFLFPAIPMVWGVLKNRWLQASALAILVIGVLLSYSRTTWISTFITICLFLTLVFLFRNGQADWKFFRKRLVVVVLVAFVFIAIVIKVGIISKLVSMNPDSLTSRLSMSRVGLGYFFESPLIGMGPLNFLQVSHVFTHNSYLSVLIEYGLVGALPWFGLIALTLGYGMKTIIRSGQRDAWILNAALFCGYVGLLIGGLAIEIQNFKVLWLMSALLIGLALRSTRLQEDEAV